MRKIQNAEAMVTRYLFPSLFVILSASCATAQDSEKLVVTVNGTPIRESQVIEEADKRINIEAANVAKRGMIYDFSARPQVRETIREDVVHALIERQLTADKLKADHIEITDAEVDARFLDQVRKRGQTLDEAEMEIQEQGQTVGDVKQRIRVSTLGVEKLYDKYATEKHLMTEADALKFYTDYPDEYDVPEERRVSRILIWFNKEGAINRVQKKNARKKAEGLLQRIKAGEDFTVLAKAYSSDEETRNRGGDRGWSARGYVKSADSDPFGNAAFAMKNVGDISDVVETDYGYDIIKLTGIRPARHKSFDEVKESLIDNNNYMEIGRFLDQFAVTNLWANANIIWDPAEKARREEKEKREHNYLARIERQEARQQKRLEQMEHPRKVLESPKMSE
jgi:parvulin-like peptidyl-prolyl isomerase